MGPPNTCHNCATEPAGKAAKAKAVLRGLLQAKQPPPSPKGRPTLCRTCATAANRQGKLFNDPLRCHVPYNAPSVRSDKSVKCEIDRYIWGGVETDTDTSPENEYEEDLLVNRVYAMLRLENSPVLEYFEREGNGCDLSGLPPDVRRRFEDIVNAQIRSL